MTTTPRWLARCSDSVKLASAIKNQVRDALAKTHKGAGWLYVLSNPSWDEGTIKFGITRDLKSRMAAYHSSNQTDVKIVMHFLCTDVVTAENKLKKYMSGSRLDDTRLEWVSLKIDEVKAAIDKTLELDEEITEAAGTEVYRCIEQQDEDDVMSDVKDRVKAKKKNKHKTGRVGNAGCSEDGEVDDAELDRESFAALSFVETKNWTHQVNVKHGKASKYVPCLFRTDDASSRACKRTKHELFKSLLPRVSGLTLNARAHSWVARLPSGATKSFSVRRYGERQAYDMAIAVIGEAKSSAS